MRGGKREGAGRKSVGRVRSTVWTTVHAKEKLKSMAEQSKVSVGIVVEHLLKADEERRII